MTLPLVRLKDVDDYGDGAEIIWFSFGDKMFQCSRRTAAHLLYTAEFLAEHYPGKRIHVIQPCFHTGYELSEGTHDGDGTLDFVILGLNDTEEDWFTAQWIFRQCGWEAWFRHTGSWAHRYRWHIHANSDGCPGEVGFYIPGQHEDYGNHTFGLAGQHNVDLDKSRFPGDVGPAPWPVSTPSQWRSDIRAVRFSYEEWEDNHMDEQTKNDIAERAAEKTLAKIMAFKPGNDDDTVKQILNRLSTSQERQP